MKRGKRLKRTDLFKTKKRLPHEIVSKSEKVKFDGAIKMAKAKGLSKDEFVEGVKSMLLRFEMGWMLEPIITERSKSLRRDIATANRLMSYVKKNW